MKVTRNFWRSHRQAGCQSAQRGQKLDVKLRERELVVLLYRTGRYRAIPLAEKLSPSPVDPFKEHEYPRPRWLSPTLPSFVSVVGVEDGAFLLWAFVDLVLGIEGLTRQYME